MNGNLAGLDKCDPCPPFLLTRERSSGVLGIYESPLEAIDGNKLFFDCTPWNVPLTVLSESLKLAVWDSMIWCELRGVDLLSLFML